MRLPLQTHLWHCWLVLTFLAILTCGSVTLSNLETVEKRTPRIHADLEHKEVMFLGDSQIATIKEGTIAIPALNLADGGMAYRIQYAFLKYYAPQMPKLNTVLIGFNNIMLRNPDIERRRGDYRTLVSAGLPWYHIPVPWRDRVDFVISYNDYLKPLLVGPRPAIKLLEGWSFLSTVNAAGPEPNKKPEAAVNVYQANFTSGKRTKKFGKAPVDGATKMRNYMIEYRDPKAEQQNRRAFFGILEYCSERRLEVVLLRTPTTQGYRTARSEEWNQALVDLVAEARTKFPDLSLSVWDAESTERVPLELFRDPNHMLPRGYVRFADYLNRRLQESPYRDDSEGLVYDPTANHLEAWDPRESTWVGLKDKENNIARVPVPAQFTDKFTEAFQVTIPPGEHLGQSDFTPVAPGVQVTADIWLWASKAVDTTGLRFKVLRDGPGAVSGNGINVVKLDEEPRSFTIAHTFTEAYDATRLQVSNQSDQPITFVMASPSLTRQ